MTARAVACGVRFPAVAMPHIGASLETFGELAMPKLTLTFKLSERGRAKALTTVKEKLPSGLVEYWTGHQVQSMTVEFDPAKDDENESWEIQAMRLANIDNDGNAYLNAAATITGGSVAAMFGLPLRPVTSNIAAIPPETYSCIPPAHAIFNDYLSNLLLMKRQLTDLIDNDQEKLFELCKRLKNPNISEASKEGHIKECDITGRWVVAADRRVKTWLPEIWEELFRLAESRNKAVKAIREEARQRRHQERVAVWENLVHEQTTVQGYCDDFGQKQYVNYRNCGFDHITKAYQDYCREFISRIMAASGYLADDWAFFNKHDGDFVINSVPTAQEHEQYTRVQKTLCNDMTQKRAFVDHDFRIGFYDGDKEQMAMSFEFIFIERRMRFIVSIA